MSKVHEVYAGLMAEADKSGRPFRPKQRIYADRWLEALTGSAARFAQGDLRTGIVLAEAETGLGKTMAYAMPLLAYASVTGKRVAIATHTHALQRQMLEGDLARINNWLCELHRAPLRVAQRVGQQAFISASSIEFAVHEIVRNRSVSSDDHERMTEFIGWAQMSNDGFRSGLIEDAVAELGDLPMGLSRKDICLEADSDAVDFTAFNAHLAKAKEADVVLVTHHYLSLTAIYRQVSSDFAAIVIDEADRLISAINNLSRHEVSIARLQRTFTSLGLETASQVVTGLMDSLYAVSKAYGTESNALIAYPESHRNEIRNQASRVHEAINTALAMNDGLDDKVRVDLSRTAILFKKFVDSEDGDYWTSAVSFSPVAALPSLAVAPMYPGRVLQRLWSEASQDNPVSVLLTSATLGVQTRSNDIRKTFNGIAMDLGIAFETARQIPLYDLWGQYEPDNFGGMRFVLPDPSMNGPVLGVDEDMNWTRLDYVWLEYAQKMIESAYQTGKNEKRTLVLSRSYNDGEILFAMLNKSGVIPPEKLIVQMRGEGQLPSQRRYVETPGAIWITPSAWEGLDLPGMVNNLVILRLPLQADDQITRALLRGSAKKNDEEVDRIMAKRRSVTAMRLFRQGIGRGIRTASDRCTVWIADPRFPVPANNPNLLNSGRALEIKTRQLGYFHDVIPQRFRAGLTNKHPAPQIFWG